MTALGFRLVPYDPARLETLSRAREKALLRAMAVAGFAAGNVMLLSVAVWAGQDMGAATRNLMHWISALIALPAIVYAGCPFFTSAIAALGARRMSMEVPISLAILLAAGMSLAETMSGGPHVYFDSAVALLFFLLIGRYLDSRARGRARSAGENLLALGAAAVTIVDPDGVCRLVPTERVETGMNAIAAAGDRIAVDAVVIEGVSDVDTGLITWESAPRPVRPGDRVFAGTLNLGAALRLEVTAVGEDTLLAEIARMMEVAEQGRARYVKLADRVARAYAPVVHGAAVATFLGWVLLGSVTWQVALLYAVAVLIITCPCALALAIPAVQVIASGRLLRRGILLKSATTLERLAEVDTVVFDNTGTLTIGRPELAAGPGIGEEELKLAASLAAASKHPLAQALVRAAPLVPLADGVQEIAGSGLAWRGAEGEVRLGSRRRCGVGEGGGRPGPELWLAAPGLPKVRFTFVDPPREDAAAVVSALRERGLAVELLSGDRRATVEVLAAELGIPEFRAETTPVDKCRRLEALAAAGHRVLMVGDGPNDAPALAAAHVSMSPSSAAEISQTAADAVFQGARLRPVLEVLEVARNARRLVRQNLALAFLYNVVTIPLAVIGLVTPLVAAIAMSSSSLLVTGNALRLGRGGGR